MPEVLIQAGEASDRFLNEPEFSLQEVHFYGSQDTVFTSDRMPETGAKMQFISARIQFTTFRSQDTVYRLGHTLQKQDMVYRSQDIISQRDLI